MSCLLTIAIATRNRAGYIGATLDSILAQLPVEAELLVMDGASTDNTAEVLSEYATRHTRLRYVRLERNGGLDRDFDHAVDLSFGEYVWLMTDDDLLRDGAINAVVESLSGRPSLVIVNAEVRNADLTEVLEERRLPFPHNRTYRGEDLDAIVSDTAFYLSFIGCVVINRSIWMSRDRERYFGSMFLHMGVIFQQPLPAKVLVLAEPFITIRYGNASWIRREFEIWMFKYPKVVWSFQFVSEEAKAVVTPREPWRKVTRLLLYRAKGAYTRAEYVKWIRPELHSMIERMRFGGVLLVPGSVANLLAHLYFTTARRRMGMTLVDLRNSPHSLRSFLGRLGHA